MVDDYLSDREQEEALRHWWRENWKWIIGGVVLGLALLGGWRYWQSYQVQRAQVAHRQYEEFQQALAQSDPAQAEQLLQQLAGEHDASPYTQHARLLLAKAHVEDGKLDEAIALLRAVIAQSKDAELVQVARLRAARVLIQQGKHDDALQLLKVASAGAFAAQLREIRGDALYAKGDEQGARAEYAAALAAAAGASGQGQIDRRLLELKMQQVGGGEQREPSDDATDDSGDGQNGQASRKGATSAEAGQS